MNDIVILGLAAAFGAIGQELIWWYELRFELATEKYQKLMRSAAYWIVVIAMVTFSAGGSLLLNWERLDSYSIRDFVIFGAAFPLIFKHLSAAAVRREGAQTLGDSRHFRTYLRADNG